MNTPAHTTFSPLNLPYQTYFYQAYFIKPTLSNLPSQTYPLKPTLSNLPSQTYYPKPNLSI